MHNKAEKDEASISALDAHSDTKGEIHNADDLRLQQMGLSYVLAGSNMQLMWSKVIPKSSLGISVS